MSKNLNISIEDVKFDLARAYQFYYYILNHPMISDHEFDLFEKELNNQLPVGSENPKDYTKAQFVLVKYLFAKYEEKL